MKNQQPATFVEALIQSCTEAVPYFKDTADPKLPSNRFPREKGVYAILRTCSIESPSNHRNVIQTQAPICLYVGKTGRTFGERLREHFRPDSDGRPNTNGSQFAKFLLQLVQDEAAVHAILRSPDTLVACAPMGGESSETISRVEKLAVSVLEPRLNVRGNPA